MKGSRASKQLLHTFPPRVLHGETRPGRTRRLGLAGGDDRRTARQSRRVGGGDGYSSHMPLYALSSSLFIPSSSSPFFSLLITTLHSLFSFPPLDHPSHLLPQHPQQGTMLKSVSVAFIPLRHCLINLPGAWANALLDQGKVPPPIFHSFIPTGRIAGHLLRPLD